MSKLVRPLAAAALFVTLPAAAAEPEPRAEYPGPRIELGGFVDASISTFLADDAARGSGVLIGLDQVELDVAVEATAQLGLRVDLNFFPARPIVRADDVIEQAYAHIGKDGPYLRAGKWNAPFSIEALDPGASFRRDPALYQFSYGLIRTFALPQNLTGVALGWSAPKVGAELWLSNDWDSPATTKNASGGARVTYREGPAALGIAGMIGPFAPRGDAPHRLLLDLDLTVNVGALVLGFELNFGAELDGEIAADERESLPRSFGALLMANYTFDAHFNLTARVDYLDRDMSDAPYEGASATLAGNFPFGHHFNVVAELRADFPREGDVTLAAALELTAYF